MPEATYKDGPSIAVSATPDPAPPRPVPAETRSGQGHRTVTAPVTCDAIPAHRDFVKKWLTRRRNPPIAECSKPMAAATSGLPPAPGSTTKTAHALPEP